MARPSVRKSASRVYRHTVKRQLEATQTLPLIQEGGFTMPVEADALFLPLEFPVFMAFETALQEQLADNGTCAIIRLIAHPGLCNVCCFRAAVPG
jgi:hypothetical protein